MSKIEWTDETWNPITGCTPVSQGCEHCYADRMATRLAGRFGYPEDEPFRPGTVHEDKLTEPLNWKKPRRVFVCSMGDLFHEDVAWDDINKVWGVMLAGADHTYQILTKRPKRAREFFEDRHHPWPAGNGPDWVAPHIWIGVTAEDQERADDRIPQLLAIPAAVRFVSCEPLLGAVDLEKSVDGSRWLGGQRGCGMTHRHGGPSPHNHGSGTYDYTGDPALPHHHHDDRCRPGIDWVIAGGESGPGARPSHPDWFRSLRDQCQAADVPFFFKQWGAWALIDSKDARGDDEECLFSAIRQQNGMDHGFRMPDDVLMRRVGKKAAGRQLDGRTWDQFPEAS